MGEVSKPSLCCSKYKISIFVWLISQFQFLSYHTGLCKQCQKYHRITRVQAQVNDLVAFMYVLSDVYFTKCTIVFPRSGVILCHMLQYSISPMWVYMWSLNRHTFLWISLVIIHTITKVTWDNAGISVLKICSVFLYNLEM